MHCTQKYANWHYLHTKRCQHTFCGQCTLYFLECSNNNQHVLCTHNTYLIKAFFPSFQQSPSVSTWLISMPLNNKLLLTCSAPPKNKSFLNIHNWSIVLLILSYPVTISCGVIAPSCAPLQLQTTLYRLLSASTYWELDCITKRWLYFLIY